MWNLVLPPRSPNLNAHCERFVRSIKEEALERMVILGERSLYYAIQQYLAHYHHERNHQGLDNQLITPEPALGRQSGSVRRRERLGGLLQLLLSRRGVTRDLVVLPYGMPTMNVYELYEQTIKSLPAAERLRLAVLILNDIYGSVCGR